MLPSIQYLHTKLKPFRREAKDKQLSEKAPVWERCSDIFYLLETIKITYDSSLGRITLEDIQIDEFDATVSSLKALNESNEFSDCPVVVTVCGVTWEYVHLSVASDGEKASQQRIRAIPKAAGLRFFEDQHVHSDAYFYQASKLMDCVPSNYFSDRLESEAKSLSDLTPQAFIHYLRNNNEKFIQDHGKIMHLHKGHFEEPMTAHEGDIITRFPHLMN